MNHLCLQARQAFHFALLQNETKAQETKQSFPALFVVCVATPHEYSRILLQIQGRLYLEQPQIHPNAGPRFVSGLYALLDYGSI